jgi:hypothetical protein
VNTELDRAKAAAPPLPPLPLVPPLPPVPLLLLVWPPLPLELAELLAPPLPLEELEAVPLELLVAVVALVVSSSPQANSAMAVDSAAMVIRRRMMGRW